jgi:putative exporter of polyketide antibiotics
MLLFCNASLVLAILQVLDVLVLVMEKQSMALEHLAARTVASSSAASGAWALNRHGR